MKPRARGCNMRARWGRQRRKLKVKRQKSKARPRHGRLRRAAAAQRTWRVDMRALVYAHAKTLHQDESGEWDGPAVSRGFSCGPSLALKLHLPCIPAAGPIPKSAGNPTKPARSLVKDESS